LPLPVLPKANWTIQEGEEGVDVDRQKERQDTLMIFLRNPLNPRALTTPTP
jgi:hypothetical protein